MTTDTIHGYDVIASSKTPTTDMTRPGRYVLVDRGEGHAQRFVTAWQGDGDDEWSTGHYFDERKAAFDDFMQRAKRG